MDRKEDVDALESRVSGVEDISAPKAAMRDDHKLEHRMTVKEVFTNHPALVWWTFFWAMAAVGWYVVFLRMS